MDAHQRARLEVLMLHIHSGPAERAAYHPACDHAMRTHSLLLVVCLPRRAAQGTAVRAVHHRGVESEQRPTLPRWPRQDLAGPEPLRAGWARRRLHARPWGQRSGADLDVQLDAALRADVPGAIERGTPSRQSLTDGALQVVSDATFHPPLVEALLEVQVIELDAGQAFRKARRREAVRSTRAAACRGRSRCRCTLRIGIHHHQWSCAAVP